MYFVKLNFTVNDFLLVKYLQEYINFKIFFLSHIPNTSFFIRCYVNCGLNSFQFSDDFSLFSCVPFLAELFLYVIIFILAFFILMVFQQYPLLLCCLQQTKPFEPFFLALKKANFVKTTSPQKCGLELAESKLLHDVGVIFEYYAPKKKQILQGI